MPVRVRDSTQTHQPKQRSSLQAVSTPTLIVTRAGQAARPEDIREHDGSERRDESAYRTAREKRVATTI